jgi:hypothetical protein
MNNAGANNIDASSYAGSRRSSQSSRGNVVHDYSSDNSSQQLNGIVIDDYSSMNSEPRVNNRIPVKIMPKIKQNKKAKLDMESIREPV